MCEIIDQITLFHALKLKPSSNDETIRWDYEMDKHLISLIHRNKCFVHIEKVDESVIPVEIIEKRIDRVKKAKKKAEILPSSRVLRPRKKKECFVYVGRIKKSVDHVKKAKKKAEIPPSSRVLRLRKKNFCLCFICVSDYKFILQLKKSEISISFRFCFFISCLININSVGIRVR